MPANIKLIRGRDFLQSAPQGEIDLKKSKEILIEIASTSKSPPDYNILIDMRRMQWMLTTSDIFFLASELARSEEHLKDKIALLVLPGTDFDKAEFFELCASNRGLTVEVFSNYEDAMQWFYENSFF